MEREKGKLLVSTKSAAAGRKIACYISCVICYLLAVGGIFTEDVFKEMAWDLFHRPSMGEILQIAFVTVAAGYATFILIVTRKGFRSYCDVYENGVVGTSGMSGSNPGAAMQKFDLSYDEITNVTESGKTLFIYTKYAKFEVLALKNCAEAAAAIRARLK